MAAIVPFIPYIIAGAGTLLQGQSANNDAKSQALQLEQNAGQTRAAAQREFGERQRSGRYAQSRALALAAASGAGASDPTVVNLISSIAGEGEYSALSAMFEGESAARDMEYGAKVARKQGKAVESAATLKAGSTILGGATSWYDKYGAGGAPTAAFNANGSVRNSVMQGTAISDFGINSARYA